MKIVSWNCNGAFRNKFEHLIEFKADLYIIQECEDPARTPHKAYQLWAENHLWIGDTKNKGIGVFASKDIDLKPLNWSNAFQDHHVKHFLPCTINNNFDLLAVWTHQNNSPNFGYIGQLWKYLQVNKHELSNAIIAGDFNSNAIWDQWDRWWNHSDVVNELRLVGMESLYHTYTGEDQGKETQPTFYVHRNPEKPYHIDYVFGSKEFSDKLTEVRLGQRDHWLTVSDHLPLICEFDL
ncbi:endonuclease/exonuclease/phosphatase family protein [Pontibacter sp. E15-1]|uniref:endonuclease/exonuclease/phosphatase family protein n=1 Tax=Pontibacter sp. E15-1 TaxID=2919918 RepID=UPI001F4F7FDD|nr:endonuclease/exonuclease/phosphatase family protein [Pontibacter sp. E15-1]MCJ8164602.1 endonuclease/exonuclease/phosphatase family protein [Pontibacter sp. E15-1]